MAVQSQGGKVLFNGHTLTSVATFIYDDTNGTASTSGVTNLRFDHNIVQIGVPSLAASCVTFRFEGKFDGLDRWAEISSTQITATTTIDRLIVINEKLKDFRVGLKAGNTATPNVVYVGICNTEIK